MLSEYDVKQVIQGLIPVLKEYKDDFTLSIYIN